MARIQMEDFSDQDISRIFIAASLKEARAVESMLTNQGLDYAVAVEPYQRLSLLSSQQSGAVFYVLSAQSSFCRDLLQKEGYSAGLVQEDG